MHFLPLLIVTLSFSTIIEAQSIDFTCGKKYVSSGLIVGGVYSERGQWPWLAALYYTHNQKYFCGATLISTKHTITAAHCIQAKQSQKILTKDEVAVLLGKHDLKELVEDGSVTKFVSEIVVHPDWNYAATKYDADIAIIVLKTPVVFSQYIAPVCLPTARFHTPIDGGVIVSSKFSKLLCYQ